jgi:hypothetical protein
VACQDLDARSQSQIGIASSPDVARGQRYRMAAIDRKGWRVNGNGACGYRLARREREFGNWPLGFSSDPDHFIAV